MAFDLSPGASGWGGDGLRRYGVLHSHLKNTRITNHEIPCYSAGQPSLPGSLLTSAQFHLSNDARKIQNNLQISV
jgi:hypothetical protein